MKRIVPYLIIALVIMSGCSVRMFTFGEEASKIDRAYTIGVSTKEGVKNVQE